MAPSGTPHHSFKNKHRTSMFTIHKFCRHQPDLLQLGYSKSKLCLLILFTAPSIPRDRKEKFQSQIRRE
jgi:hypothetical protein